MTMLDLDPWAFDQTDKGWRSLVRLSAGAAIAALEAYAAAYLRDDKWVEAPPGEKQLDPTLLFWHLGQLLACGGQTTEAIPRMRASHSNGRDPKWDAYVLATIAFLEGDRTSFDKHAAGPNYNRPTLKRLANNWGKTYNEAYALQSPERPRSNRRGGEKGGAGESSKP